jgi:hypothetical protein
LWKEDLALERSEPIQQLLFGAGHSQVPLFAFILEWIGTDDVLPFLPSHFFLTFKSCTFNSSSFVAPFALLLFPLSSASSSIVGFGVSSIIPSSFAASSCAIAKRLGGVAASGS